MFSFCFRRKSNYLLHIHDLHVTQYKRLHCVSIYLVLILIVMRLQSPISSDPMLVLTLDDHTVSFTPSLPTDPMLPRLYCVSLDGTKFDSSIHSDPHRSNLHFVLLSFPKLPRSYHEHCILSKHVFKSRSS